jgi:predicted MFS family arabinose efflux permease
MLRAGKRAAFGTHLSAGPVAMRRRRPLDRSPPFMTILVAAALFASAALLPCLRRAPLITLLCVGLLGFGVHAGVLNLPAAITTPLARANADVHAWQQRQSAALACEVAQTHALMGEDEREMDRATRVCTSGVWPPIPH